MTYFFLDTNIFIHYSDFEQLPWQTFISDEVDFSIVICNSVIREIDKLKDTGSPKIKRRAKNISAKIGEIFLNNKSVKVKVVNCKDPSSEKFDGLIFNKDIKDDSIILSALNFSSENKGKVVCVSSDNTLLIKAKQSGFDFLKLDDKFKINEELTEEEREINNLKNELDGYKRRLPSPVILFSNGQSTLLYNRPLILDIEDIVNSKLVLEKENNPYDVFYPPKSHTEGTLHEILAERSQFRTKDQVDKFNYELDKYFKEFETKIRFDTENEILSTYLQPINFFIFNNGTAPTGDIEISINIPDNIDLYCNECVKKRLIENPLKPIKNGHNRETLRIIQETKKTINYSKLLVNGYKEDWSYCWDLSKKLKDNKFNIKRKKLMHKVSAEPLDILDIYIDTRYCENFSIDYMIFDENLINPVSGKLSVIIK